MKRFGAALLFIAIIVPAGIHAHPHMFIDMSVDPEFSSRGFEGVRITWLFDNVFTASVIVDNGLEWKDTFTRYEIDLIEENAFSNLINYNYYTYFSSGNRIYPAEKVRDFRAFMTDGRLAYEFFVPFPTDFGSSGRLELGVAVYDQSYFCDIAYLESSPVTVTAADGLEVSYRLEENRDKPIFYDNSSQRTAREGMEYSGTAFPVELKLTALKKGE